MDVGGIMQRYRELLRSDEGCRLFPYRDSRGVWSVGWGRNLQVRPISQALADILLDYDMLQSLVEAAAWLDSFERLSLPRQMAASSMCYQLGERGAREFVRVSAAVGNGRFDQAASAMEASRWAKQTPGRVARLAEMMRKG